MTSRALAGRPNRSVRCLAAILLLMSIPAGAASPPQSIAGLVERVLVGDAGVELEAKLDTGADTSSIDATEISSERRSGRTWISFTVVRKKGDRVRLTGRLVRYVHVRRIGGGTQRRPVVALPVCLGSISRTVEVSLADREGFEYDFLVGRNFLNGYFMVDPARVHTVNPACGTDHGR